MSRRTPQIVMHAGILAIVMGLSKTHAAYGPSPYDFTESQRLQWSMGFFALVAVSAYAMGLPDVPRRSRQIFAAAVAAGVLGATGISLLQLAMGSPLLPRMVVLGSTILVVPWFAVCAVASRGGRSRAGDRDRVVVIGVQEDSRGLSNELDGRSERPGMVVATVTPDEARPGPNRPTPIRDLVEASGATVLVLDREAQASQAIVDQVALLHETGIRVRTLSLFYEQWLGKLPIGELERVSLMFDIGELHRLRYGRVKRVLDVTVAIVGLPLLVAVTPVVWALNLVANRGPLFFTQTRVGKGRAHFRMYKFRTMRPGTESTNWTTADDERITRFGGFLRAAHLDELPQVVNILRGDLSLVGPRPEQPHYVEQLEAKLPYYQLRHLVQPGVTGWAQVKYGYGRSEGDALEKLQYEFYYLRRQALAVDLRILARTMRTVLPFGGPRWS